MVACELVPAMFDPETKQVIYNPGQTRTQKKDLVVTIAQDVKTEKSSQTSKSESFGLNLGFQNSGVPSFGVNYQKVKITAQRQERHHQVNIAINILVIVTKAARNTLIKYFSWQITLFTVMQSKNVSTDETCNFWSRRRLGQYSRVGR